jgi:Rod binding domain-containing protein
VSLSQTIQQVATAKEILPRMQQLRKTAKAMESHFFKEMLQEMKKTAPDAKFGDDFGSDTYEDMFDEAVSNALSSGAHLGLADMVYRSLEPRAISEELKTQAAKKAAARTLAANGEQK